MITLGARSDFSFMRGYGTPKQWRARADELELEALGVADYCSTWGHAAFSEAFKGANTKLVLGVTVPVVTVLEKDPRHDLVCIFARSVESLARLYEVMGLAELQSYYRPRLTWAQVAELAATCNVVASDLSLGSLKAAERVNGLMIGARPVRDNVLRLVKEGVFPVVPLYAPRYPSVEDRGVFDLMQAVSAMQRIGEAGGDRNFHAMRRGDYVAAMRAVGVEPLGDWFSNAARIVTPFDFPKAAKIKIANDPDDAYRRLLQLCRDGAKRLGIKIEGAYKERIERELHVINEKVFGDYFLFVADIVNWAKERMIVGPARGSAGGSLLCYLLGITAIDPIKYGTLFERFIDITRPDWPDIDVDFPDVRRDEVIAYIKEKYGADHFARLGTVSEFGGKSAINDTAKAKGVPYEVARSLGNIVEGYTVSGQALKSLAEIFEDDAEAAKIVAAHPDLLLATRLEDHARHHGVHAAGVVVSNEPICSFGTILKDGTISMEMKQAEKTGLIKMDVLGLRTLTVIQECLDLAGVDRSTLDRLDFLAFDAKTKEVFNKDRVTGVFQFDGNAVRSLMRQVKVETFDDLCALTSLARPGPLVGGAAATWVARRAGNLAWDFRHPSLAKHLGSTFGCIVYQEQAMGIVRDLAGFDEPSVNGFRRAVGKKDRERLRGYEGAFLRGCAAQDISAEVATELWDEMCDFGSYAFNYSHAVGYSMLSYITAYLKAHHPMEYAIAQLRHAASDEQGKALLRELADEGYEYVPFDAVKSLAGWSIIDGRLYGGFDSVRGIGAKTAKLLLEAREADPENWLDDLTDSQRDRLLAPNNTPWDSLAYFQKKYAALYADPSAFRSTNITAGIKPPVFKIKDILANHPRGTYRFLGRIVRKTTKDANAPDKVAKRGSKVSGATTFVNLIFQDDTGEIGTTINRFKVPQFGWLIDSAFEGRDFLVKGEIIGDGPWLFIDNIVEIENDASSATGEGEVDGRGSESVQATEAEPNRDATVRADGDGAGRGKAARTRGRAARRVPRRRREVQAEP